MKHDILAHQPRDLTIDWAQRVVSNHYSGVIVSDVHIVSVDIGTTTRIRLAIEHNGPQNLPRRWFVKLPSLIWRARMITALPRLLHTEIRFYNEVAQAVPVAVPRFLAAQSKPGKGATLVLRDITECGAIPGNPGDALTVEQAAPVVKQLARFHAHFWNKTDLLQTYYWLAGPVRRLEDYLGTALAVPLMKRGLHRAGKLIPPALRRWLSTMRGIAAGQCISFQMHHKHLFIMIVIRVIYSGTNLNLVFLIGNSFVLATGSATWPISWPPPSNRRSGGSMK